MAEKQLVPHYRLINPLTEKIQYMYINSELNNFISNKCISDFSDVKRINVISLGGTGFEKTKEAPKELQPFLNDVYEIDLGIVNSPSGIYFLYDNDELVYIGETIQVLRRLQDHIYENKKNFSKAFFIKINKEKTLKIETELIRFFKPKYNGVKKADSNLEKINEFKEIDYIVKN